MILASVRCPRRCQVSQRTKARPTAIEHSPKNRSCPSRIRISCMKVRRHSVGDKKGNMPSSTSINASASQKTSESKPYFLPAGAGVVAPPPRITLKNSLEEGSSTITSLFLPKLAL